MPLDTPKLNLPPDAALGSHNNIYRLAHRGAQTSYAICCFYQAFVLDFQAQHSGPSGAWLALPFPQARPYDIMTASRSNSKAVLVAQSG